MKSALEIAGINLKANARYPFLAAAVLCALVPLFIGTANLGGNAAAQPLEMFVSLVGIVLLTPVFAPEQKEEISDLVLSKYVDAAMVYLIRMIYSIALAAVLVVLFAAYMSVRGCEVTLFLVMGTLADAVFLGALGMFASVVSGNTVIGYMAPVLYYAVNIGMGRRMGDFYLFSMMLGEYGPKLRLFWAGVLLMGVSLALWRVRRRLQ